MDSGSILSIYFSLASHGLKQANFESQWGHTVMQLREKTQIMLGTNMSLSDFQSNCLTANSFPREAAEHECLDESSDGIPELHQEQYLSSKSNEFEE